MLLRRLYPWLCLTIGFFLILLTSWPLATSTSTWAGVPPYDYQYRLEWPEQIRAGEPRTARLSITAPSGFSPGTVIQARLEFASLQSRPAGTVSLPAGASRSVTFIWTLLPVQRPSQNGTLWIYSISPSGNTSQLLSTRPLRLRQLHLGRIPLAVPRWLGIFLLLLGAASLRFRRTTALPTPQ
jgi:hypothetical protein